MSCLMFYLINEISCILTRWFETTLCSVSVLNMLHFILLIPHYHTKISFTQFKNSNKIDYFMKQSSQRHHPRYTSPSGINHKKKIKKSSKEGMNQRLMVKKDTCVWGYILKSIRVGWQVGLFFSIFFVIMLFYTFKLLTKKLDHLDHIKWHKRCKSLSFQ